MGGNITSNHQKRLFGSSETASFKLPDFSGSHLTDTYDQMELLGFHLTHPFKLLKNKIESRLKVSDFKNYIGKTVCIYGYLICIKRARTSNIHYMYFGTFYDYRFQVFDTIHFPNIARKYPVHGTGVYKCTGKVTDEFGHLSLQIHSIHQMPIKPDPRFVGGD